MLHNLFGVNAKRKRNATSLAATSSFCVDTLNTSLFGTTESKDDNSGDLSYVGKFLLSVQY